MVRSVLLRMSRSAFLERQFRHRRFARLAVRRFMPGEDLEDALTAGRVLGRGEMGLVLTRLGEEIESESGAAAAARHYLKVLSRIASLGMDAEISVKPTQLGLALGTDVARRHLESLVRAADELDAMVWVDMEDSSYVDPTLALVAGLRRVSPCVGVCLQAYLHRTPDDLTSLMDPPIRVRLVKGAYREHPSLAIRKKRDIDTRFHDLAVRMLSAPAYAASAPPVFGTHDDRLIEQIRLAARQCSVPETGLEFHLLYGIRTDLQKRLAAEGSRVRVLIAYGEHWYPWYMRRLAERPANVWFVARQALRSPGLRARAPLLSCLG